MKEKPFVISLAFTCILLSLAFQTSVVKASDVHDVAVVGTVAFPSGRVYPAMTVYANVTVENQGTVEESFNVTLYAGNFTIQTLTISNLAPGLSTNLTFEWKLFPVRPMIFPPPWFPGVVMRRTLPLKAEATVVDGEEDTLDNVYINGPINVVWMVPDVTGDGRVDMKDISSIARRFGSYPGHPMWNPDIDFNQDGKIDMRDISPTARAFGELHIIERMKSRDGSQFNSLIQSYLVGVHFFLNWFTRTASNSGIWPRFSATSMYAQS